MARCAKDPWVYQLFDSVFWDLAPQGSERIRRLFKERQLQRNQTPASGMDMLKGKVALVTGGSKGIGKAACLALSRLGASVVINYASDPSSAEALVKDIGSDHALGVQADAGSVKGADEMVKATIDRFGKIDILIANAGMRVRSEVL